MADNEVNENLDGADGVDGDAEDGKKGGLNAKKVLLFVVIPIFLLAGVGGGLYFSGIIGTI